MSRELIIKSWCDRCQALGNDRTEARHVYTIGIVKGETRPAPRVIELCDECDAELDWLPKLVADFSIPLDPKHPMAAPAKPPAAPYSGDRVVCRVCDKELAKTAILGHVWAKHRPGQDRPIPPTVCPECRTVFDNGTGMWMHRSAMHGVTALDEAYKGLV